MIVDVDLSDADGVKVTHARARKHAHTRTHVTHTRARVCARVQDPNDGLFWMARDDALRYFQTFYVLLKPMQAAPKTRAPTRVRTHSCTHARTHVHTHTRVRAYTHARTQTHVLLSRCRRPTYIVRARARILCESISAHARVRAHGTHTRAWQGEMVAKKVVDQGVSKPKPVSDVKKANLEIKNAVHAHPPTHPHTRLHAHTRAPARARAPTASLAITIGPAHVCAGIDRPTSAPGPTGPHLRRDRPTSAPGPAHICAGTGPHLRRDRPTSAPGPAGEQGPVRQRLRRQLEVVGREGGARARACVVVRNGKAVSVSFSDAYNECNSCTSHESTGRAGAGMRPRSLQGRRIEPFAPRVARHAASAARRRLSAAVVRRRSPVGGCPSAMARRLRRFVCEA